MYRYGRVILCLVCVVFFCSCAHRLEIKNLSEYETEGINPLRKPVSIGIIYDGTDVNVSKIIQSVGLELQKFTPEVILPYILNSKQKVDVIIKIDINPEYSGSGWNFLVNFPGFLIFAPAWHGYNYNVSYKISVSLLNAKDNKNIDDFNLPINLKVCQAEIDRTWIELSWLGIDYGALAFFGGLYSTAYDADITPGVTLAVKKTIGEHLAQKIISIINSSGQFGFLFKMNTEKRHQLALK